MASKTIKNQFARRLCISAFFLLPIFFSGCSPVSIALYETANNLILSKKNNSIEPNLEHTDLALVEVSNHKFLITKISRKKTPQGIEEIWLTPGNEVIRTRNRRITSTSGSLYADWANTQYLNLLSWKSISSKINAGQNVQYIRKRNINPIGLYDLTELVAIKKSSPAKISEIYQNHQIEWFEEQSSIIDSASRISDIWKKNLLDSTTLEPLPPAKFGVIFLEDGEEEVIYSNQCLSIQVCLTTHYLLKDKNASYHSKQ